MIVVNKKRNKKIMKIIGFIENDYNCNFKISHTKLEHLELLKKDFKNNEIELLKLLRKYNIDLFLFVSILKSQIKLRKRTQ